MKKIFSFISILSLILIAMTGIGCGGSDNGSDVVKNVSVSGVSSSNPVSSSNVKRTMYPDNNDYAQTGFTHIDGVLFARFPSVVAFQVDDNGESSTITSWSIAAEGDSACNADVISFIRAGDKFNGVSDNTFRQLTATDIIPIHIEGSSFNDKNNAWEITTFDTYKNVNAPAAFKVDYVWINTEILEVYGDTDAGKSFITTIYSKNMSDYTYNPYRETTSDNMWSTAFNAFAASKIFPELDTYAMYKFNAINPMTIFTEGTSVYTPHVTKPMVVTMLHCVGGTDPAVVSATALSMDDGVEVLYDGGNTASDQAKVLKDLWRTFSGWLSENGSAILPSRHKLYIFPTSQYTTDPSKVAIVNVGAYTETPDAVNITLDIQKSFGAYDSTHNAVYPVAFIKGFNLEMKAPMNTSIKFAPSVLVE